LNITMHESNPTLMPPARKQRFEKIPAFATSIRLLVSSHEI